MKYSELHKKEVISAKEGKKLGRICDMEIDECHGTILKIMVPGGNGWKCLCSEENFICIPYSCICQIGPDIILVNI